MVKKAINRNIRKSIDKFVEEIKKKYNVDIDVFEKVMFILDKIIGR